jgi:hypothetical protein
MASVRDSIGTPLGNKFGKIENCVGCSPLFDNEDVVRRLVMRPILLGNGVQWMFVAQLLYNRVSTAPIAARRVSKIRIMRVERTIGLNVGILKNGKVNDTNTY